MTRRKIINLAVTTCACLYSMATWITWEYYGFVNALIYWLFFSALLLLAVWRDTNRTTISDTELTISRHEGIVVGDFIKINDEYMRVISVFPPTITVASLKVVEDEQDIS